MLMAFKELLKDTKGTLLVNFQRNRGNAEGEDSPFMEVLQPEFAGKLRKFELDLDSSYKIIEHFNLPMAETAVIFENGTTDKRLHGFKNVRNYLRTLAQKN